VRARAEDAVLGAGNDHRFHLGVLEADALERVGELDVDAEVVRVELQGVAGTKAAVLLDVERDARDLAAVLARKIEPHVRVAIGVGFEADGIETGFVVGAHAGRKLGQDRTASKYYTAGSLEHDAL